MSTAHPVPATNLVVLAGTLSRPAELRSLPSGDRLLLLDVTVRPPEGPTDSVPVAWFDPPRDAEAWDAGHPVVVTGRVHRRFFRAGAATQSRVEVVATTVVPARRRATARRAVDAAVAPLVPVASG